MSIFAITHLLFQDGFESVPQRAWAALWWPKIALDKSTVHAYNDRSLFGNSLTLAGLACLAMDQTVHRGIAVSVRATAARKGSRWSVVAEV